MKLIRIIVASLLVLSVLFSTSGVLVYKHYCGDFLADLSLYSPSHGCGDEDSDGCDEGDPNMDCCEDETEFHKAELDLIKVEKSKQSFHFFAIPYQIDDKSEFNSFQLSLTELKDRGPPLHRRPLYISLSRLTYYG